MSHRSRDRDRTHRRREHRPRRAPLTPEQRAYRVAQRRANLKLSFLMHFVTYGSVCVMLLFVAGFRPAFIVALCWGIGLAVHYFGAVVAPQLRHRWVDQEVGRQVHESVTRERRALEGKHVQSLEELSASIAHEIRNPVTAAKSLVQQMGEDPVANQNVERVPARKLVGLRETRRSSLSGRALPAILRHAGPTVWRASFGCLVLWLL